MTAATWEIIRHQPAPPSFWTVWFFCLLAFSGMGAALYPSVRGLVIVAVRAFDVAVWAVAR